MLFCDEISAEKQKDVGSGSSLGQVDWFYSGLEVFLVDFDLFVVRVELLDPPVENVLLLLRSKMLVGGFRGYVFSGKLELRLK